MKKSWDFIVDGYVRLLLPLLICIIFIEKLLHILNPLIHQIKDKLHVTKWVGVLDVFLVSIVVLLVLGLLCGLLLKLKFVQKIIKGLENSVLRKIPLYNELKSLLTKNNVSISENYLPALIQDDDGFSLGYVTDQSAHFYTVVICDTSLHGGELKVLRKDLVKLLDISFYEFAKSIRSYGAKAAHFAEKVKDL